MHQVKSLSWTGSVGTLLVLLLPGIAHAQQGIDFVLFWAFALAAPYIAIGMIVVFVWWLVSGRRSTKSATFDALPPACEQIQFSDEEIELMQRYSVFFNGHQFRLGDVTYQTLPEACAAAISKEPQIL